ncbi:hypothetical protein [Microbacterium sp.]
MSEAIEIRVEVEDDAAYIWEGFDAETRYERWALDGEETYDHTEPLDA